MTTFAGTVMAAMSAEVNDDFVSLSVGASLVCEMASSFPPPTEDALRTVAALLQSSNASLWREQLKRRDLSTETSSRAEAIVLASSALLSQESDPWADRLTSILTRYEEWHVPHVLAVTTAPTPSEAIRRLNLAHRIAPIGDQQLVDAAHILCDTRQFKSREQLSLDRVLATHEPTMRNFATWLRHALDAKDYEPAWDAAQLALDFHGSDAADWSVSSDTYGDLMAAAALCGQLGRAAARTGDKSFDFGAWNLCERRFAEMAVERAPDECARSQALGGLATAGVQLMMRSDRGEPWTSLAAEAQSIERAIIEYGQGDAGRSRHGHRLLAQLAMTSARRARQRGVGESELTSLVNTALRRLENWAQAGDADDHALIQHRRIDFHLEFGLSTEALALVATPNSRVHAARRLMKQGSTREAIKELVRMLENVEELDARQIVATCCALHEVMASASRRGVQFEGGLAARAQEALKLRVALLVDVANHQIRDDNLAAADRTLAAALQADPGAPNLWHLKARLLTQAKDHAGALKLLTGVFADNPVLTRDKHLTSMFLTALRRTGQLYGFRPEKVWQLAEASGEPDAYARYDILRWQIDVRQMDGWEEQLLRALSRYPEDALIPGLPQYLWRRRATHSLHTLRRLLAEAVSTTDTESIVRILDTLPGEVFFVDDLAIPKSLAWSPLPIRSAVTRGLVRGQLRSTNDATRTLRIERAAEWISEVSLPDDSRTLWLDWFGSERKLLERLAAWEARRRLRALRSQMVRSEQSAGAWTKILTEFLQSNSPPTREGARGPADRLVSFCGAAQADYRPFHVDSSYWSRLSECVQDWMASAEKSHTSREAAAVWRRLNEFLGQVVRHRIISVCYWPVHSFKNRLAHSDNVPLSKSEVREFEDVLAQATRSINWQRIPRLKRQDLRMVVERAAYLTAFEATSRSTCKPTHAVWCHRGGEPVWAMVDERLLNEALRCVLHNATRSLGRSDQRGGGWIRLELRDDANGVAIDIADNGAGCPSDELAALNDPSRDPVSTWGSGFGTRLCHRIVRLHGGTAIFASEGPSLGFRVTLTLPVETPGHA